MNTQEIWTDFNDILMKFIKSRVKNEYDAEDILQEVFRKIHLSIHRLTDESKVQSWVYQIARNAITDYYRTNAKRRSMETSADTEPELDLPEEAEQDSNLNEVVGRWLKCMVQSLDDKYKDAILLTEFGNATQKELAEKLGISVSGAKSRVQRGREKLKEKLLACCHIERDRLGNVIGYERRSNGCHFRC